MTDLHLKYVIELGFKTIRANPDRFIKDIFGNAQLEPHAAIYGNRMIEMVKNWFMKTDVPVVLGFDLTEAKFPAVTIVLQGASPAMPMLGDYMGHEWEDVPSQEREVLVPKFVPESATETSEGALMITPPANMPLEQKELFLPGLTVRDNKNKEYPLSLDDNGNILILEKNSPLSEIDLTELEVISPYMDARYSRGAMIYDEQAVVGVHGHSNRNEGLWLYYIVMWILLRSRPILAATFGMELSFPSASDFSKDDSFADNNIWRRFISVSTKTTWTWEQAKQKDILGLIMSVFYEPYES
jgi:hypothetical protein